MSKWIDIDDAIEIVTKIQGMWATTLHALCDASSIDLVRCRECQHWQTDWIPDGDGVIEDFHYCPIIDGCQFGDWYCADGERGRRASR